MYSQQVGHTVPAVVTGKPLVLGGAQRPNEATGRGLVYLIQESAQHLKMDLSKCSAVVQGFGNVGSNAALFLERLGVKIIGVGDATTGLHNPKGLSVASLREYVRQNRFLKGYSHAEEISNAELLELLLTFSCQQHSRIKSRLKMRTVSSVVFLPKARNGPTTLEADKILTQKEIFILPDILANAGGVTVSYFEWVQDTQNYMWTLEEVNARLQHILTDAFRRTLTRAERDRLDMRTAATIEGVERAAAAKLARGLFP